ncbi:MAG: hypothetical protein A3E02_00700 [Candidatus Zambryskibacteria bacterium RIFCSPHIGHO2_12_FULL_38_34]|uniref:Uncharacterized protein n=1 Tax=Candidatus Zambryskibacteria bacterium RIFCSPLOWO2_12_FULL_39_16 TaxID=1802775 RepID=A0A1G2UQU8_9BACT|nr:MAG: hypothetical protein A3D37_02160 [Candidatus Zambryskibacteria bacterium RIFCSPHIGHO2_02_FULL_38_22]OHA97317.1 MAG: hypothetical protein A3E02_00700 [Candidatus Zambryskibacteria bacterium RIFCSPHIGHO2_12_FULL_38_34]OHB08239.1 MAG: hypothetical protein A3I19_01945 [Candidatus Zambryskibacteria bacterium RIFCSPLOWO2_02_FULL_38_13]OHB11781.1 MAG: hypothetical protein A3G46_01565 [Candidatus Zambryskibacteria bacterium RIFCSPLOWO2_12_FULL_39_16]
MQKNTQEKPIYFYVANLGSEVQRMFVWKEKGDKEATQNAYKRAISIIERIKSFGNKSANTEMDILQRSLVELISGGKESILDRNQISLYFNPFALRVMNNL